MTSIHYDKIFSRFYANVTAYDIAELDDATHINMLHEWLHAASSKPYVRVLFSSFNLDDEIEELQFEIKNSVDDFFDSEFVIGVLAVGIGIEWLEPKVNNTLNVAQIFASSDEKFYSQANHLSELRALLNDMQVEQRRIIRDHGYAWNSYLKAGKS